MTDNECILASIDLRRKLLSVLKEFYVENKNLEQEQMFFINSAVIASLLAQIAHTMFKKDSHLEQLKKYIDHVCQGAKIQLKNAKELFETGIQ